MPMPSQESAGSSSGQFDSEPRRSRIHFPLDDPSPSRHLARTTDAATNTLPRATKTSSSHRHSPLKPRNPSSRRRVRSVGTHADVFTDSPLSRKQFSNGIMTPPRAMTSHTERDFDSMEGENLGHNIFTDEYDLSHEDPRILQDVQRALKLKARREARLLNQYTPPRHELARPQRTVSATMHPVSPISPNLRKESMSSDIDFSPSTGASLVHPVPTSLNNGLTLDWSGFDDKHESRWKLPGAKRKGKEAMPPIAIVMEQQETAYADKLGRLKSMATSNTVKKAKVTQDQLERRYKLVYSLLSTGQTPNIAKVSRWYREQDSSARNALEKAEPFMWVRHLEKRSPRPAERSPWHISAIIAEEYLRSRSRHDAMMTIYEDSPLHEGSYESPTNPDSSRPVSNHMLGPSIARKLFFEDGLTFEPHVNSTRTSLEVQSQESSFSSLPIGSTSTTPSSPTRGRGRPRDVSQPLSSFTSRIQERLAEPLMSEESDNGDVQDQRSPMTSPDMNIKVISASDDSDDEGASRAGLPMPPAAPTPLDTDPTRKEVSLPSLPSRPTLSDRRRNYASLPSADRTSKSSEMQRQQAADEEKAYETKLRLLEQTTATNHRIRQLLNRISGGIREYDTVQSNAMSSLGIAHIGLPRDLIDAFGHDPAAVTGATRRFQGWRAVDDIQHRLVRQREVFRAFLSQAQSEVHQTKSVLEDPISSFVQFLKALELHSDVIAGRAFEVGEALKAVQETHDKVKIDYNDTLARTSAVYPELSRIIALEERYKDQYQQFWEFGMDTLTFILDTVTPFWRSYGKLIGDDMRDFLIIPLYRNEFTGETKRYPISRMPTRSFRHWLGLILFFFASVTVAFLQVRAALSSSAFYKLQMIPYESVRWTALPFFWLSIVVQWWAVVAESVIVLLQFGVVVWWAGWSVRLFT